MTSTSHDLIEFNAFSWIPVRITGVWVRVRFRVKVKVRVRGRVRVRVTVRVRIRPFSALFSFM